MKKFALLLPVLLPVLLATACEVNGAEFMVKAQNSEASCYNYKEPYNGAPDVTLCTIPSKDGKKMTFLGAYKQGKYPFQGRFILTVEETAEAEKAAQAQAAQIPPPAPVLPVDQGSASTAPTK